MSSLVLENVTIKYKDLIIVENISLKATNNEFIGLIGANGSGKTTILKSIYKSKAISSGEIRINGKNIDRWNIKKMSQLVGVIRQENEIYANYSVLDMVLMGRNPYKKLFENYSKYDEKLSLEALKKIGLLGKKDHLFNTLSGGEKQRVYIARILVQNVSLLILDEPTNHLDIGYQLQFFDLIKSLNITVLAAIHDLNMAALYCDRIYSIQNGRILLKGKPEEVLKEENIQNLYKIKAKVKKDNVISKQVIHYYPKSMMSKR